MMDAAVVSGSDVPHDHYDSSSSEDDEILIGRKDALNGRGINHPRLSDILEDSDDGDDDDADGDVSSRRKYNIPQKDHLYNPDKDDEDEAYVYKHLRHGVEENVAIRRKKSNKKEEDTGNNLYGNGSTSTSQQKQQSNGSHPSSPQTKFQKQQQSSNVELPSSTAAANAAAFNLEQAKIFKPRSSDAVLSCPCCFQIVCMDCQRHERYTNQFRAMFVMNIDVRWDVHVDVDGDVDVDEEGADMKVNESARGEDMRNHGKSSRPNEGKSENGDVSMSEMGSSVPTIPTTHHNEKKLVYHSVVCNSCQTEVAALDMRDEVYHFFGCLVSS